MLLIHFSVEWIRDTAKHVNMIGLYISSSSMVGLKSVYTTTVAAMDITVLEYQSNFFSLQSIQILLFHFVSM